MKLLARRALAVLAWSPLLLTLTGCANQGEGERCDARNFNADCESGLICSYLELTQDHICCPVSPPFTSAACNQATGGPRDAGIDSDAAMPEARVEAGAEASAPDTATSDAVGETTNDRSTVDTQGDIRPDLSTDGSTTDIQPDGAARDAQDAQDAPDAPDDAPSNADQTPTDGVNDTSSIDGTTPDVAPDGPADSAGEASPDAPGIDIMTPIDADDAADAPSADGLG